MLSRSVAVVSLAVSASAFSPVVTPRSFVGSSSQLQAEDPKWEPADGMKWEENDWEGALSKLQQEAEKSMDSKIAELTANIEKVGK